MAQPAGLVTLTVLLGCPLAILRLTQFGRAGEAPALAWYVRDNRGLPASGAERQVWSIWGGYLAGCFAVGLPGSPAPARRAGTQSSEGRLICSSPWWGWRLQGGCGR